MSKEKADNKSVSKELLKSCQQALYRVQNTFDEISGEDFDDMEINDKLDMADKINKIIGGLGKSIETLAILEAKVEREELDSTKRRGNAKNSQFED